MTARIFSLTSPPPDCAKPSQEDRCHGEENYSLRAQGLPQKLQDLPPESARLCLDILRFMTDDLLVPLNGRRIMVGFSGGADSTALLLILHYLAPKSGIALVAAHLDHALRPSSSQEADACKAFCESLSIPFVSERIDINALQKENGMGTEEAARFARYAFYQKTQTETACDLMALGHQQNDLAEDILMRLLRGAGWPALGGMEASDTNRKLIRPLLLTSKERLETFLASLKVHWIVDESNTDHRYFRNRVRGTLIPLLLEENPSFLETAANLWRLARLDKSLFTALLPSPLQTATTDASGNECIEASPTMLTTLHKALRLRYHKECLDALGPGQASLAGLFALDAAWENTPNPTEHHFPGKKRATIRKKRIVWQRTRK